MDLLYALLPIATLIFSILFFRRTVTQAVTLSIVVLLVSLFYWGVGVSAVGASTLRGVLLAFEIIIVVFSAVLIFEILERQKLFSVISRRLDSISKDKVVQTLFVLLGVVFFMEGVAGFGTPAIIAIPLLLSIGYKPTQAVILSLLADTIPVSFGAVGLPVSFGIGSVLSTVDPANSENLLGSIIARIALVNVFGMVLLSIALLVVIKRFMENNDFKISKYIPFVSVVVIVSSLVSIFSAVYLGPELPSILGGLAAIVTILFMSRHGILIKKAITKPELLSEDKTLITDKKQLYRAVVPYLLLIFLLLLTRLPVFGVGEFLQKLEVSFFSIFSSDIDYSIAPLYSAATILLLVAAFSLFWFHETREKTTKIVSDVLKLVSRPFVALSLTLIFVQMFINSQSSELQAMPVVIAEYLSGSVGVFWPFVSPFVGALGSFLSGSATVSNLIFTGIQYDVAIESSLSASSVITLQSVGAAVGNMVALHNVIAALVIAKLSDKNASMIIRYNIKYLALLLLAIGTVGMFIA